MNYWRLTPLACQRMQDARYAVEPLGELVTMVQYGSSALAKLEPPGVPILRMNNLQDDGWNLSDLKYIVLTDRELTRHRLVPGDILFNRTNSKELVGKCAVFREPGDWVFASYLIRVRTDERRLLPQFASDFLATATGRLQIDRLSRQIIGMTNINAEEIRELRIPLPPIGEQERLICAMDVARERRRAQLDQAEKIVVGLDSFLLENLGLTRPIEDMRRVFAVRYDEARSQGRLNSDYYHPERILALRTLDGAGRDLAIVHLSQVVSFNRDRVPEPGDNYLGLAHIQSHTGEISAATEEAEGTCFLYEAGDILFARLRPYLNKVYRPENAGCCSGEFHVLRVKVPADVVPDYLALVLRSRLVLAQTVHMMTGNTHPRLANEDVANLRIPIPAPAVQKTVVSELGRRRQDARRLRLKAETEWQAAKAWLERQLLRDPKTEGST